MAVLTIFTVAGVIILLGFLGEYIFEKTNIPDVIWLMIIGIIIGAVFNFQERPGFAETAEIFTTFALIFILFEGALNIDIKKMVKGIAGGSSLSFLNFFFSTIIVAITMRLIGWTFLEGLLLGAIVGGASSAVIIPLTKKINIKSKTALVLTFESAISDVLCIVGALTILNIIVLQAFSFGTVLQRIVYSFTIAIFIGVIGGLAWIKIQDTIEKFSKSYMITIAALMLLYSFVEFLDSNGAIACLSFGIIVGNARKIFSFLDSENEFYLTRSDKFFFSEISFFVKVFFFVYLGLIIDLQNFGLLLLGFLLTVLLFLIRPWSVNIVSKRTHMSDHDRKFMEILTPKGLAAAVLAQLPAQAGLPYGTEFSTISLSIIFFSILISTIGVYMTEKGKFKGLAHFLDLRKLIKKL